MKRVGGYLKSILPLVAMLGIQFAASTVQMIRFMLQYGVEEGTQIYMNDTMTILLISDVLLLGVAGLWYYISVVRRREKYGLRETSLFQKKDLAGLLLMAVGAQFLIGILMSGWEVLDPKSMQEYTDLIESAGLGESGISAILATVIIGPVAEELIFRGLTVEYLKRAGASFWVINILQALFFGIAHLNLVQGSYAFLIGLLAGYLVLRCHSIWAGIAFHMLFNGYYLVEPLIAGVLGVLPEVLQVICLVVFGLLLVALPLRRLIRDTKERTIG